MPVDITIPSPGESITEVVLGPWSRSDGDWVEKDEALVEIESDKVTLEVPAPESGVLHIGASEGDEMEVGQAIGSIDTDAKKPSSNGYATSEPKPGDQQDNGKEQDRRDDSADVEQQAKQEVAAENEQARATSVARKMAADQGIDLANVQGTGPSGRITKHDVEHAVKDQSSGAIARSTAGDVDAGDRQQATSIASVVTGSRGSRREKMSKLRQRIAERLVEAQHNAAMLTTFNEADMSEVMRLRKQHKETFAERHRVGLGFMSFFVKACVSALQALPNVNSYIVGDEVEYHDFVDISVAVGTPKGLVVPVLRNAEQMSFAEVEQTIKDLATRARDGKLTMDEMTGGTFTISNGGIYGSLNSTPILNPPQSGILGMHKIMNRAVEDPKNPGHIVLRPMMYLALSYDHRIVDGEGAVKFLIHVKNCIENPERLLLGL